MTFSSAVKTCMRKYWVSVGRASRAEYWWFHLFLLIIGFFAGIADAALFGVKDASGELKGPEPFYWVSFLITFLPSLCVVVRRLHDINRSGYWWLIGLTIVGLIPLVYWLCQKGTEGENRFGTDPFAEKPSAA
jgi:uncharacterized membrane protein YhaH (DUF805 family)